MELLGTIASSTRQGLVTGSFDSIATVTTTSGGTAVFTNIPQTYKNLQIRILGRGNKSSVNNDGCALRFNNNTANYNYLGGRAAYGNTTSGNARTDSPWIGGSTFGLAISQMGQTNLNSANGTLVIAEIYNYTSTTTTKNAQSVSGYDTNGSQDQYILFLQGMWNDTAAITQIEVFPNSSGGWAANSHIALYGLKG